MHIYKSISELPKTSWCENHICSSENFLRGLEESYSVGEEQGWQSHFLTDDNENYIYSYLKSHSFGEYIFDWSWANTYERYGYNYYPKMTSMAPFSSATVDHFLMKEFRTDQANKLLGEFDHYIDGLNVSGSHFLFLPNRELPVFQDSRYLIRDSFQYHFLNRDYVDFQDFLKSLKTRKVKQIRKEREGVNFLYIEKITGNSLSNAHAKEMYDFYLRTIASKGSYAYLTESFFEHLFSSMKDQILYVRATKDGEAIAGSLFLFDSERLYGRYWGSHLPVKGLHFELCYYQGIEFLIEKKLKVFEAGAQGEHKISRGFEPTRVYSAHYLKDARFHKAIEQFIGEERSQIDELLVHLSSYLPYKNYF